MYNPAPTFPVRQNYAQQSKYSNMPSHYNLQGKINATGANILTSANIASSAGKTIPTYSKQLSFVHKQHNSQSAVHPHQDSDNTIFEILGVKVHFDDLLILCILLFLYQEKINDDYLFISLILLLLS